MRPLGGADARALRVALIALLCGRSYARIALDVTHDELALVSTQGPLAVLGWSEGGINPPLLPLLANLVPTSLVVGVGRLGAVLAALATFVLLDRLASRLRPDAGPWVGPLVVALLGVQPVHAVASAELRVYAWWALAMGVHLVATERALREEATRGAVVGSAASLALLGWCHYLAVPVAGAEVLWLATRGPAGRRLLRTLPVVALAWAPLAVLVVRHAAARRAQGGALEALELMATGGLGLASNPWGPLTLAGVVGLGLWRWPSLPATAQLAVVQVLAALVLFPLAGLVHTVRPPVALGVLVPWAVLAGAVLPLPPRSTWAQLALGLFGLATVQLLPEGRAGAFRGDDPLAVEAVLRDWGRWPGEAVEEAWLVDDPTLLRVCYQATGAYPLRRPGGPEPGCSLDGVRLRRVPEPLEEGWLVQPADRGAPGAPEGCVPARDAGAYVVLRCTAR